MVDQVLLELLRQLRTQGLYVFYLTSHLGTDLHYLLVYVPREEVSSLSRIVSSVFHVLCHLQKLLLALLFDDPNLFHHVFYQALDQSLCFSIRTKPRVYFHFDHFSQLLSHLDLLCLEIVNVIFDLVIDLGQIIPQVNLQLSPLQLFLLHPPIDGPNLNFETVLEGEDSFILPLEFGPDHRVHGGVAVAHLLPFVLGLLRVELLLDVHLVPQVVQAPHPLLLLLQQPIHQISHLDFQPLLELILDLAEDILEVIVVPEGGDFEPADVIPFLLEVILHKMEVLLNIHHLPFQLLYDVIDHGLGDVAFFLELDGVLFGAGEAGLEGLDTVFVVVLELLVELVLLVGLLPQAHHLVEQHGALLLALDPRQVVIIQFFLEEGTHLSEFLVALVLDALDKVHELSVGLVGVLQAVPHLQPRPLLPPDLLFQGIYL
mmetsp:Transcript_2287/g.2227  ORF Transcript_2287/g.2227 Transcript_2287/m.2227 type:complete len:430 (-) Transcript_2287:456-1745(-)